LSERVRDDVSPSDIAAWRVHLGTGREPLIGELDTGTLHDAVATTARQDPNRQALLFPGDTDRWLTRGELVARSARTAGWLIQKGLRPQDRVLLCGHNTTTFVIAYLALLQCGATVVLASPAYTADELAHLVADSQAEWSFAARPAADSLTGTRLVSLDEPLPEAEPSTVDRIGSHDVALLAYTSGTTGKPKGVPLTHGNLLSSIRAAMASWRWSDQDMLVHSLPLSHQHGLGGIHATLLAGSSAVIVPDAADLGRAVLTHSATVLFAVPAIYERLITEAETALAAPTLRLAVSGSAPLDPRLAGEVAEIMGVPPLERYGSTESGLNVSNPIAGPRRPGTVGLPLPGVELRVADDSGAEVPAGTDGEILLRGPQVFSGYGNRPEATREAFHPGGWFRTGDVGRVDQQSGYLTITGRKKELIITGGLNVYPREVELALERHPAVAEAAVAGVPSQRWGEEVTAWVVPSGQVDPGDVIEHARRLLAAYKCPKQVFTVDSLPRNSMGKLQRSALLPLDTSGLDRAVAKLWEADLS
jgi:malonyl-CoA/methylmalonyl-CoA synthetase